MAAMGIPWEQPAGRTTNGYTVSFSDVQALPWPECSLSGNGLHHRKYQVQRTWTVTDPCGNATTAQQNINIVDDTPPVIDCPADVTVECSDDLTSGSQGVATATDNCDMPNELTISESDNIINGACIGEDVIERTWTAEDICGNTSTCVQTISTFDTTASDLTCPADIVIECDESLDPSNTGDATVMDNCDPGITANYSDNTIPGACDDQYTVERDLDGDRRLW